MYKILLACGTSQLIDNVLFSMLKNPVSEGSNNQREDSQSISNENEAEEQIVENSSRKRKALDDIVLSEISKEKKIKTEKQTKKTKKVKKEKNEKKRKRSKEEG